MPRNCATEILVAGQAGRGAGNMPSSAASAVLWDVLSRSGVERAHPNEEAPAKKKLSTNTLTRRLQFHTLLQDALDAEPWEVEGYNAHEAAVQEKAEAIESLRTFERKPHMLCMLPPGVIKRVLHPTSWSDEAALVRSELPAHERTARNLLAFFKTLRLESKAISHIDSALVKMSNLHELSLRDNEIVEVDNLAPNISLLSLCMNRIEALGARGPEEAPFDGNNSGSHSAILSSGTTRKRDKPTEKLPVVKKEANNHQRQSHGPAGRGKEAAAKPAHAKPGKGAKSVMKVVREEEEPLSWNQVLRRRSRPSVMLLTAAHNVIRDVTHIRVLFPGLQILHLGFNNLLNVVETTAALKPLTQLSVLTLVGNPMCLRKDYRTRLVNGLRGVTRLDGVEVEEWERNTKLSDHTLILGAKILTQWTDALAARRRSDFEQEGVHSDQDRYTFIEVSAARKLQRLYRAAKKRQVSTMQRKVLQAEKRGELVTLRVCVDWLKLALPVEPVPVTPAKGKKPDPKAAVVEEPEGPKEQLTVRLVVPSELQLAYSLPYKDKKALIEFNHTQEFQLPVTPELRDAFFFRGLRFQVWSKRPEAEGNPEDLDTPRSSLSSATAKEPQQVLLAKGVLSFRPFFDAAAFKTSLGSPVLTHEASLRLVPIPKRRRHPARSEAPTPPTIPDPVPAQMPMPGGGKKPAAGVVVPEAAPPAPISNDPIDAVLRLRVELNAAPVPVPEAPTPSPTDVVPPKA